MALRQDWDKLKLSEPKLKLSQTKCLSPRHLGSHNLGRRDLLLSAGEIVGLVLFPHPRDRVQGGPTVLSLHNSSSTKGTFIPCTYSQAGGGRGFHRPRTALSTQLLGPFPVDSTG